MSLIRVKICGITSLEDARAAVSAGADALGFIFAPSKRHVEPDAVAKIVDRIPVLVTRVGVFMDADPSEVMELIESCSLDCVQLHGEEDQEYIDRLRGHTKVIKTIRPETEFEKGLRTQADAYLLDNAGTDGKSGGTGRALDPELAARFIKQAQAPVLLSGGLTPESVAAAIRHCRPYGVDVCSGAESEPGKKDHDKLRSFVRNVFSCA